MYTCPIQLGDVRYNAASQSFEATVTVHDNATVRKYACAIAAPISMSYENAAKGLSRQAIRRHQQRGGLFSSAQDSYAKLRTVRPGIDPVRWLERLIHRPDRSAA
ncbi:MAG: orotidine 5-phosphate decarboxylase [Sulfitobacter sp.]